jgi:homocysteine S-methyltransferase
MLAQLESTFAITVEVVTPAGPDPSALLRSLRSIADLPFYGFSVATNPVAKARMSSLAFCSLIVGNLGKPAVLHCTTRDHNRLSIQGLLWGARAVGIDTVLAATGDFVALEERQSTTTVRDVDVFGLVELAREAGLETGVVMTPYPNPDQMETELRRLERKIRKGAQFAVTQPIYDESGAQGLSELVQDLSIPVMMGILPLRTSRHADFLHERVAGIYVPEEVRTRMKRAEDQISEGISLAREALILAREYFGGACVMPPFGHYEIVPQIL